MNLSSTPPCGRRSTIDIGDINKRSLCRGSLALFAIFDRGRNSKGFSRGVLAISTSLAFAACATVPSETVELSYLIGQDLVHLQNTYELLIEQHFQSYREQRLSYLDNEWTPAYVAAWIEDGRLIDTARGVVVYNESTDKFVAPSPGREEQQLLTTIHSWGDAAIAEIEDKRASLLDPLDQEERKIRKEARAAFGQLIQANAVITAHLNSIRQVHDLQGSALEELGVNDVISSLNNRLIEI